MAGATLLTMFASASACATGEGDSEHMVVDTVGGVVHVRHSADAARWRIRELASIGSAEGPASFGRIVSVLADADGNVYVGDVQASEIRVFGPDGAHVRTFGRKGSGPGEFQDIYSAGWLGDSLAVLDPRNGRIGLFSRTGEWLAQIPYPGITGPDIRLHQVGPDLYMLDIASDAEGKLVRRWVRAGRGVNDTIPHPEQRATGARGTILCRPSSGGLTFFTNRFIAQSFQSPAPNRRVALVGGGEYRVDLVNAAGDTALVILKNHPLVPITDGEWEEATRPAREWMAKAGGAKCDPVEFTRPAGKPAIRSVFFDDAARLWVEATTATGHSFDLFDGRGVHLANIPSPARQRSVPPYVRGDRLYLVTADSLDVQSVKVYAIER